MRGVADGTFKFNLRGVGREQPNPEIHISATEAGIWTDPRGGVGLDRTDHRVIGVSMVHNGTILQFRCVAEDLQAFGEAIANLGKTMR